MASPPIATSDQLVHELRRILADHDDIQEKNMFGGTAFMHRGNMFCGVVKEKIMVLLGEEGVEAALELPHTAPMDFTGRISKTRIFVEPEGWRTPAEVEEWVERAFGYSWTLKAK